MLDYFWNIVRKFQNRKQAKRSKILIIYVYFYHKNNYYLYQRKVYVIHTGRTSKLLYIYFMTSESALSN